MTPTKLWNRDNPEHVAFFLSSLVGPLAFALGHRAFEDRETDPPRVREAAKRAAMQTARVWLETLDDIPREVLTEAARRVARASRFWPRPAEIRAAAAEVADEVRRELALEARQVREACMVCSEGWRTVKGPDGFDVVERCDCRRAADRILAARPPALALPAARPAESVEVTA